MRPRAIAKEIVYRLAHEGGVAALGRRINRTGLIVLTYHSFGPASEHPYIHRLPVTQLKTQIAHLRKYYEIVSLESGVARMEHGLSGLSSKPMIAITVDDGYGDNYQHLYPVVREANIPITIFLATDYLDSGREPWPTRLSAILHFATAEVIREPIALSLRTANDRSNAGKCLRRYLSRMDHAQRDEVLESLRVKLHPKSYPSLAPLTWDQVREMSATCVQFGSHTRFHGWLDQISNAETIAELEQSRLRLQTETGLPCTAFAYPNGNWSREVANLIARCGYGMALTQDSGINFKKTIDRYAIRRIDIPHNEGIGTFACRVSGAAL